MTRKQSVMEKGKLLDNPHNLSLPDLKEFHRWKRRQVDCPWCLLRAPLSLFATFTKHTRKGMQRLSKKKVNCPECHQGMKMATILMVTEMTVQDYAIWFWTNIYQWRAYERVYWDSLTARIKRWPYEERQTFWGIWRKMSPKHEGMTAEQIEQEERDYQGYVDAREASDLADYENYARAFEEEPSDE